MNTSIKSSKCWITATAAAALLAGCGTPVDLGSQEPTLGLGSPSSLDQACPGKRYIGRLSARGSCPRAGLGWTTSRLFSLAGIKFTKGNRKVPNALKRYCLYQWNRKKAPTAKQRKRLPADGKIPALDWLDRDCMVVAPTGTTTAAEKLVFKSLTKRFAAMVEQPGALPVSANPRVSVAVVDSWPRQNVGSGTPSNPLGNLRHGLAMGQIVKDLTCPGTPCTTRIVRHLALNLMKDGKANNKTGGFFGYQGHLAATIFHAVKEWQINDPASRLVINLSLGWDGRYNGSTAGLNAQVRAVRAAIDHAVCQGALVIAAAGNATRGPSPGVGPVYPAAWATQNAPACLGAAHPVPLLYAVSGTDGKDKPLGNLRPSGRAPLAAYAFNVPTLYKPGSAKVFTEPLTGSSVAAAVAAAAAALVWHYDPSRSGHQVMEAVRTNGQQLSYAADFCHSPSCPKVRRVSICRTLNAVLNTNLKCRQVGNGAGQNPRWSTSAINTIKAGVPIKNGKNTYPATAPGCTRQTQWRTSTFPQYPCPSETLPGISQAPHASPQPDDIPCGACFMLRDPNLVVNLLFLGINPRLNGDAYPMLLHLHNDGGGVQEQIFIGDLFPGGLPPDSMTIIDVELPANYFHYASIVWMDGNTHEVSEVPIF